MGFANGAVMFRRLYQTGRPIEGMSDELLETIAAHAFGKRGEASSDGIETGWIVPQHLFDVDFTDPERILFGRFLFLAMRLDRTAPPAGIVHSYRRMEEAAAREAGGSETLSRSDRRLAKEAAAGRAEKEARAGMFRRIAAYPVLIDLNEGTVFLGNLGAVAGGKFLSLFSDTFDITLVPATAEELAFRLAEEKGWQPSFEDAKPTYFVTPPTHFDVNGDAGLQDRSFLGREFLLWLWSRCETHEGLFELPRHGSVTIAIEKLMSLSCGFDLTGTAVLRSEVPASSPEAQAALRIGKQPTKVGMMVNTSRANWSFTLDAATLNVTGLSIAKSEEEDPQDILDDRFGQIADVASLVDEVFAEFLARRLGQHWSDESNTLRRWASNGKHAGSPEQRVQLASA